MLENKLLSSPDVTFNHEPQHDHGGVALQCDAGLHVQGLGIAIKLLLTCQSSFLGHPGHTVSIFAGPLIEDTVFIVSSLLGFSMIVTSRGG